MVAVAACVSMPVFIDERQSKVFVCSTLGLLIDDRVEEEEKKNAFLNEFLFLAYTRFSSSLTHTNIYRRQNDVLEYWHIQYAICLKSICTMSFFYIDWKLKIAAFIMVIQIYTNTIRMKSFKFSWTILRTHLPVEHTHETLNGSRLTC